MNKGRCEAAATAFQRALNCEQGLTLLEVLIALGIIATAIGFRNHDSVFSR